MSRRLIPRARRRRHTRRAAACNRRGRSV